MPLHPVLCATLFERPLLTPERMLQWDRWTMETLGLPDSLLMESAARECAAVLETALGGFAGKRVLCLAGPGHNGGDAIAMARCAHDRGAVTALHLVKPQSAYTGSPRKHLQWAKAVGVPVAPLAKLDWRRPMAASGNADASETAGMTVAPHTMGADHPHHVDVVVDGLLGAGFAGELREEYIAWVEAINALRRRPAPPLIFAVDIPTGLHGRTGAPSPVAVRADITVCMEAAKTGLVIPEAAPWVGRLEVRRIGIPQRVKNALPTPRGVLGDDVVALWEAPEAFIHKGSAGRVLIVGGSPGLTGAPALAGLGALRAGAGLVSAACPAAVTGEVKQGLPELMTTPLCDDERPGALTPACLDALGELLPATDAVAVGMGLGRRPETTRFLAEFLAMERPPTVFDADALYHLAAAPSLMERLRESDVLTPHPGEMARLMTARFAGAGLDEAEAMRRIKADRFAVAEAFVRDQSFTLVLKGAGTVVAQHVQDYTFVEDAHTPVSLYCPEAHAVLAVGGSGDVLAGVIATALGRGLSPLPAACLGVYWHATTGRALSRHAPGRGVMAREIAHALPHAMKELLACKQPKTS